MSFAYCTQEDLHPYACEGSGRCRHCDRADTADHDPRTCALCDPAYDGQPNRWRDQPIPGQLTVDENPAYGPGNPDWEHDREREDH